VFYNVFDSAIVDDALSMNVFMRLADGAKGDSVTTADLVTTKVFSKTSDSATIDDSITAVQVLFRSMEDGLSIDDSISTRVSYNVFDSATVDDAVFVKLQISLADGAKGDSVTTADLVTTKIITKTSDSATVDDTITKRVFIRLADGAKGDSVTTADLVSTKVFSNTADSATVDDSITAVQMLFRTTEDGMSIDDSILVRVLSSTSDSTTVNDSITKRVFYNVFDSTTIDDTILLKGAILIETRDEADNLILGAEYIILPNPFTGTGSLPVIDGGAGDNDTINNGQIKVYYVPLDLYRINQTLAPAGFKSIYNFTYTTVHNTDINATALFRVVTIPTDLTQEAPIEADIVDIDVPPGFDSTINSISLFKSRNGTQTNQFLD